MLSESLQYTLSGVLLIVFSVTYLVFGASANRDKLDPNDGGGSTILIAVGVATMLLGCIMLFLGAG